MKVYPRFDYVRTRASPGPTLKEQWRTYFETFVRIKYEGKYYLVKLVRHHVLNVDELSRQQMMEGAYEQAVHSSTHLFIEQCLAEVMKIQTHFIPHDLGGCWLDSNQEDDPEYTRTTTKRSFSNSMLLLI